MTSPLTMHTPDQIDHNFRQQDPPVHFLTTGTSLFHRNYLNIIRIENPKNFGESHVYRIAYIHTLPSHIPVESDTNIREMTSDMDDMMHSAITYAFTNAKHETFYDGIDSQFCDIISQFVMAYGAAAISSIEKILDSSSSTIETTEEALRQMGKITDAHTHAARLDLLLRKLSSPIPRIRDAVSIGLASLDDPSAIPFLLHAVETEQSAWVRTNLALSLKQLSEDM